MSDHEPDEDDLVDLVMDDLARDEEAEVHALDDVILRRPRGKGTAPLGSAPPRPPGADVPGLRGRTTIETAAEARALGVQRCWRCTHIDHVEKDCPKRPATMLVKRPRRKISTPPAAPAPGAPRRRKAPQAMPTAEIVVPRGAPEPADPLMAMLVGRLAGAEREVRRIRAAISALGSA